MCDENFTDKIGTLFMDVMEEGEESLGGGVVIKLQESVDENVISISD